MTAPLTAAMSAALDEIIRAVVAKADPALMRELREEYDRQRKDSIRTAVRIPQGVSYACFTHHTDIDWKFTNKHR